MIHIYHSKDFRASCDGLAKWFSEADAKAAFLSDKYELVATVGMTAGDETDAELGTAYSMTQHIDVAWTDNDDADLNVYSKSTPKRSTSVGDILLTGDGIFYMVAPLGFTKLESFTTS